jgi:hypothetical protein
MRMPFLIVLVCFAGFFALICSVMFIQSVAAGNLSGAVVTGLFAFVLVRLIWRNALGTDPAAKPAPQPAPPQPN